MMTIETRPLPSKAHSRALVEACIASIAARKAAHEDYLDALSGENTDKAASALAAFEASVAAADWAATSALNFLERKDGTP